MKEKIKLHSKTIFKDVLDTVGKGPYDCLTHEYDRLYKAYSRRNKRVVPFIKEHFPDLPAEKVHHLKIYLLGIYILLEDEPLPGLPRGKHSHPLFFQRFIYRLLSSSKSLPEVPDESTSFFLTLFLEDSPLKDILPSPVPHSQQEKLQELINDEETNPEDRFLKLIELIMRD